MRWYIRHRGRVEGPFTEKTVMRWLREKRRYGAELCVEGYTKWSPIEETPFAPLAPPNPSGSLLSTMVVVRYVLGGLIVVFSIVLVGGLIYGLAADARDPPEPAPVVAQQTPPAPPQDPRVVAFRSLSGGLVERMCTGEDAQRLAATAVQNGVTFSVAECRRVGSRCADQLARGYGASISSCGSDDDSCVDRATDGMDEEFQRCFLASAARLIQ